MDKNIKEELRKAHVKMGESMLRLWQIESNIKKLKRMKLLTKIIAILIFLAFWIGAVIGIISCNKVNEVGQVEVTGFIIERLPDNYAKSKLNFDIYDDIGESFYSKSNSGDQLPIAWNISYQVPNFKNQYAVLLNAEVNGWNETAAYFLVNFSSLTNRPLLYVYEDNEVRIVLRLKWY